MMTTVSSEISSKGPIGWVNFFEKSPHFLMASEGQLAFHSGEQADSMTRNIVVKLIKKISLQWSQVQVDPLTADLACVAAYWHEDRMDSTNNKISQDGFFTAVAEKTPEGWKFRNSHWSVSK
jgi:hypothetical protein